MAKTLVELHGGTLVGHSDGLGKGSEFAVRLPVMKTIPTAVPAPCPIARCEKLRVLVVDDNQDAADSLADVLGTLGHEVRVAYRGGAAIATATEMHPDLVFLDVGLPDTSGHDVAAQIRLGPARAAFLVALTGYGQERDRQRALAAGFDCHLVKPMSMPALERTIASVKK